MKKDSLVLMLLFLCSITPFVVLLCNQNGNYGYDTQEEMMSKCSNLCGLNDLILNKTTISDIYNNYPSEDYKRGFETMKRGVFTFNPNIDHHCYNEIGDSIDWFIVELDNVRINDHNERVELHFYQDTLIEINYRYPNYSSQGWYSKRFPKSFAKIHGKGCPADDDYLDSVSYRGEWYYLNGINRKYINGDINMVINSVYWDIVVFHKPKLMELISKIESVTEKESTTTFDYGASQPRGYNSMGPNDKEYWESVQREKALKDMGMKDAAKIERQKRLEYLQGGGYTSPNGGSQVRYQGSKEQQEDLRRIEQMGW